MKRPGLKSHSKFGGRRTVTHTEQKVKIIQLSFHYITEQNINLYISYFILFIEVLLPPVPKAFDKAKG